MPVHPPDASYYDAGADGFEVDDELVRRFGCASTLPLRPVSPHICACAPLACHPAPGLV